MSKKSNESEFNFSFLSKIHFQLYLRKSWSNENILARRNLLIALQDSPELLSQFENYFIHWVSKEPNGEYSVLAKKALKNLPDDKYPIPISEKRVLGKLCIAEAFYFYDRGKRADTIQRILKGIYYYPSGIKNYGMWVALFKSLIGIGYKQIIQKPCTLDFNNIPLSLKEKIETDTQSKLIKLESINPDNFSEQIYSLKTQKQEYILRTFPNDYSNLQIRLRIIRELQSFNIQIPELITCSDLHNPTLAWLLEEKVPGNTYFPDRHSNQENIEILSNLLINLRKLHSIPAKGFGQIKNINLFAEYSSFEEWLFNEKEFILLGFFTGVIPESIGNILNKALLYLEKNHIVMPVLCHGDLQPENIIIKNNDSIKIIDWESCLGNDPAYDIAIFFFSISDWFSFPENNIFAELLSIYAKKNDPSLLLRIIAYQILILAKNYMWEAEQTGAEKPDFDINDLNKQLSNLLNQKPIFPEEQFSQKEI